MRLIPILSQKFVGIMMDNMYDFFLSTFTFSDLVNDILAGYIQTEEFPEWKPKSSNNSILSGPNECLRNLKSRLASSKGGPHYSRSDIDTTRELYVYNLLISVALRQSAMMCQYLGQSERSIAIRKNKFTIRCNLKNWNGEPCQIVQVSPSFQSMYMSFPLIRYVFRLTRSTLITRCTPFSKDSPSLSAATSNVSSSNSRAIGQKGDWLGCWVIST